MIYYKINLHLIKNECDVLLGIVNGKCLSGFRRDEGIFQLFLTSAIPHAFDNYLFTIKIWRKFKC